MILAHQPSRCNARSPAGTAGRTATYAATPRRDTVKVLTRAVVVLAKQVQQLQKDGHEQRGRVARVEVRTGRLEAETGHTAYLAEQVDDLGRQVRRLREGGGG
jgi:hypothetical protein